MDFSDSEHSASDLVIQSVAEHEPIEICDNEILTVLDQWRSRSVASDSQPMAFSLDKTQFFTISYDANAANYYPGEKQNWLAESLTRDILFKDGICTLNDFTPRAFAIAYKVLALVGIEYLLVCPYPSEAGNIAGIVVICVNHHLCEGVAAG